MTRLPFPLRCAAAFLRCYLGLFDRWVEWWNDEAQRREDAARGGRPAVGRAWLERDPDYDELPPRR